MKSSDTLKQTSLMDKEFLRLARMNWKNTSQFFRISLVKDIYAITCSIRKTAKLLGLGKSTVHHYLKYYRYCGSSDFSYGEQVSMLKELLTEIHILPLYADPSMHDVVSDHLPCGDEAEVKTR